VARIYLALTGFAGCLLIANFAVGIWVGDLNGGAAKMQMEASRLRLAREGGDEQQIAEAEESLVVAADALAPVKKRHGIHFLLGVLSALVCILVNGIAMTYFIGSSKWCAEVVDVYRLDVSLAARSQALKRRAFPWTFSGVLMVVVIVALGGASDPATQIASSADWVIWHWIVAVLGSLWIIVALLNQAGLIGAHYEVIHEIVAVVEERKRAMADQESSDSHSAAASAD